MRFRSCTVRVRSFCRPGVLRQGRQDAALHGFVAQHLKQQLHDVAHAGLRPGGRTSARHSAHARYLYTQLLHALMRIDLQDRINSFILNSNLQVDLACAMIRADTRLWGGYNAVGASQGSQFLYAHSLQCSVSGRSLALGAEALACTHRRALAQLCPWPPMRTLLTLGGQHQGVYGIPQCDQKYGPERCEIIRRALSELVYSECAARLLLLDLIWSCVLLCTYQYTCEYEYGGFEQNTRHWRDLFTF